MKDNSRALRLRFLPFRTKLPLQPTRALRAISWLFVATFLLSGVGLVFFPHWTTSVYPVAGAAGLLLPLFGLALVALLSEDRLLPADRDRARTPSGPELS
jgi:hypothetical protein